MGEVVWPHPPEAERQGVHGHWPNVKTWFPSMLRVVVVLFRQCDDQLKVGLPSMEVHLTPLVTN
jgi:hypothetical protein